VLVSGALCITPLSIMSASVASAAPVDDFTTYNFGPANYGGNAIEVTGSRAVKLSKEIKQAL